MKSKLDREPGFLDFFGDWKEMKRSEGFHSIKNCTRRLLGKRNRRKERNGYCLKCEPLLGKRAKNLTPDDIDIIKSAFIDVNSNPEEFCLNEDISVYSALMEGL